MKPSTVVVLFAASLVHAHTIFQKISVNGADQGQLKGIRAPNTNNPITNVGDSAMGCNYQSYKDNNIINVPAGARVGAWWAHVIGGPQGQNDPDNPIAASHKGPLIAYMAKVDNAASASTSGLRWFKIHQDGLDGSGKWGVDRLISSGGWHYFDIPQCIAPGNYLLRSEIIALHNAYSAGGAQFYLGCVQINVTGGGSSTGTNTISLPGGYSSNDPGITINIYGTGGVPNNSGKSYPVPGPSVFQCGSSGGGGGGGNPTTTSQPQPTSGGGGGGGTVPLYGQCGGNGYSGPTTCASGTCKATNEWYIVDAHPSGGAHENHSTPERRAFLKYAQRSIADCKDRLEQGGYVSKAIERRAALADELRARNGLRVKRDIAQVLATDHQSNRTDLGRHSSAKDVFTGHLQCVLQGELTEGPFYVKGEYIRSHITEGQRGVPLHVDYQFIDVNTCQPLEGAFIEVWHANATGVYGGVIDAENANGNPNDLSNVNNTMLRGVQRTDKDGVVQFQSVVPAHYFMRTNHIHLLADVGSQVLPNNTITGGHIAHTGQGFFDQKLIDAVEATYPYTLSTIPKWTNAEDFFMAEEAKSMDPVHEYVLLGEGVQDGILAWLTVGINPLFERGVTPGAVWTENGGVDNPNSWRPQPGDAIPPYYMSRAAMMAAGSATAGAAPAATTTAN